MRTFSVFMCAGRDRTQKKCWIEKGFCPQIIYTGFYYLFPSYETVIVGQGSTTKGSSVVLYLFIYFTIEHGEINETTVRCAVQCAPGIESNRPTPQFSMQTLRAPSLPPSLLSIFRA
jgi:hypothetical protein